MASAGHGAGVEGLARGALSVSVLQCGEQQVEFLAHCHDYTDFHIVSVDRVCRAAKLRKVFRVAEVRRVAGLRRA